MSNKNLRVARLIFSSDYMHMANDKNVSKTIIIPPKTINANVATAYGYVDVTLPVPAGSISRSIIEYKGVNASTSSYMLSNGSLTVLESFQKFFRWEIFWYRINATQVRFAYYIIRYPNTTSRAITTPSLTFTIHQQYLKAPS